MKKRKWYKAAAGLASVSMLAGSLGVLPVNVQAAPKESSVEVGRETKTDFTAKAEETVTKVQAEDFTYVTLSLPFGSDMSKNFVKEKEPVSDGGMHIKTSNIGATVTLKFTGTGVRFYTKKGNGAGTLSVTIDGKSYGDISEYTSGPAQFKQKVFEAGDISKENEEHTLVLTTKQGAQNNFNFDYFEIIEKEEIHYQESPGNTTYYLDSKAEPGGDGLSKEAAFDSLDDVNGYKFAAGDKILIKAGSKFEGQLYPKGSGDAEAPIVIDMYGEGEKPLIDGNGRYSDAPSVHDDGPFGGKGSAVYLYNQEYWEINNLKVKNWSDDNKDKERSGIRVEASGGGVYHHIYIRDCDIADIRGYNGQDSIWDVIPENGGTTFYGARTTHRTGGINVVSYTKRDTSGGLGTAGAILDEEPTIFDGVVIEDNKIENCHANGITTTNIRGELTDKAYRHRNVVIRGNEVKNVQRAGIVPLYTSGALVEHNLVDTFQQTYAGYGCGIWCDRADGMLFQYNEVCNGRNTMDGMAFNLDDMTENGVIQYNYSHNNVGGGIMLHVRTNSYNRNNTVRYNLSVNDTRGYAAHQAVIVCVGEDATSKIESAKVYNNTFINENVVHPVYQGNEILFANNIFYFPNEGMSAKKDAYIVGAKTVFKNNVFAGAHSSSEPSGNNNVSVEDAGLSGNLHGTESLEDAKERVKLTYDSPAFGIGDTQVVGVENDFFGNPAVAGGKANAGLYNGEAVEKVPDVEGPDEPKPDFDDEPSEEECMVEYVEAENDSVTKVGDYTTASGENSQGHAGAHIYFSKAGSYVEYTFTGKAISLYTKTGKGAGTADIYVDGEQVGVDDQYSEVESFNKRAYTIVFEEEGTHTIRVENNGKKNPSSAGITMNIDCFKVFHEKPDQETELSTDVLEYAIELAKKADTQNVITDVVIRFEEALKNAEVILEKANAHEASVTQKTVDESWQELIKVMQYLSFCQGDKTELDKVIAAAKEIVLGQYMEEGKDAFRTALTAAEHTAKDGNAMQAEVDNVWKALVKAMSELRLKPDKTALEELLKEANGLKAEGVDKVIAERFQKAYAAAALVYADETVEQKEVDVAADELRASVAAVKFAIGQTEKAEEKTSANIGESVHRTETKTNTSAIVKSVKTGDETSAFLLTALMACAALAAYCAKSKER